MNTATGRHGQETRDGLFHAVSLSGGRDSTSLLLGMIERDMPIDAVLFADTGMEFPEVYENLAMLDDLLSRERGIHVTTLRHPKGFEYLMFDYVLKKPKAVEKRIIRGIIPKGYGWPGVRVRWCTGQLKTHLIEREMRRLKQEYAALSAENKKIYLELKQSRKEMMELLTVKHNVERILGMTPEKTEPRRQREQGR